MNHYLNNLVEMVKIVNWNINGARGKSMNLLTNTKEFNIESPLGEFINNYNPDVICFSETKCQDIHTELFNCLPFPYKKWNCSQIKKGYSGVAVLSKLPFNYLGSIPTLEDNDMEGRSLVLDFNDFILITVYTPNSGTKSEYRQLWDIRVKEYLSFLLDYDKPVIYGGDLNVVHKEIDIYEPKVYYAEKMAGVLNYEKSGFQNILDIGYLDIWRYKNPNKQCWTWWNPRIKARLRNIGWRIDYFLIRHQDKDLVIETQIHNEVLGSDHCPISIELDLENKPKH